MQVYILKLYVTPDHQKNEFTTVCKSWNKIFFFFVDLEERIAKVVNENPDAHFFMDEVPLEFGITAEQLAEISKNISLDNFLWIACQSQFHPSADDLREYGKKL